MTNSAREEYKGRAAAALIPPSRFQSGTLSFLPGKTSRERETIKNILQRFNETGIRFCLVAGWE